MLLKQYSAAQYVRMSTDMQNYSIENQTDALALYAARRGLTIVRTYIDAGRSGITIEGRTALQQLMADVRDKIANFETILVYDVSRWGRFQDSDESAHYEFLCKEAGVRIEYCAEQFENDGSLTSTILKNIKRAMAGEFSRELSQKVFVGQCKIVSKGFFIGSRSGFGLRRCIVDEKGTQRQTLEFGQRKAISSDRIILVPGPENELSTVRDIYKMFIEDKLPIIGIAKKLNNGKVLNGYGRPWSDAAVRAILSNEKYIGTSVFNRTSSKLNSSQQKNPKDLWVKSYDAFEPIVPKERFLQARQQIKRNSRVCEKNRLLDYLSAIWCKEKRLNIRIINSSVAPGARTYSTHFGGLVAAYQKIGYSPPFSARESAVTRMWIISDIIEKIRNLGGEAEHERGSSQIKINNELVLSIVVSGQIQNQEKRNFQIPQFPDRKTDILIVAIVHEESSMFEEYLIIPTLFLMNSRWLTLSTSHLRKLMPFRSKTFQSLLDNCIRT